VRIEVHLYATLLEYVPGARLGAPQVLDVPPGTTVGDVVARLGLPPEEVAIVMVNGVHRDADHVLAEGDRLALFPPIAGG
jgi:sulfur carrier protein ThiS